MIQQLGSQFAQQRMATAIGAIERQTAAMFDPDAIAKMKTQSEEITNEAVF